ncbi:beta-glucuronosyltransferase GlcAT14A [Tanacetum coccineum]
MQIPSPTTTTTIIITITTTIVLLTIFFTTTTTQPPPPSFSDPHLFPHKTQYLKTDPSPPIISYLISGSKNDSGRIVRLLLAVYHPRNQYLLHLDQSASQKERDKLALYVQGVKVFWAAHNVNVVGKSDVVSSKGSSVVSAVLHGAAILLKVCEDWDWFVNLNANDYPLVTQDGNFFGFFSAYCTNVLKMVINYIGSSVKCLEF